MKTKLAPTYVRHMVDTAPDWIALERYGHSLERLLDSHPEGCSPELTARALGIPVAEAQAIEAAVLQKFRDAMGVDETEE